MKTQMQIEAELPENKLFGIVPEKEGYVVTFADTGFYDYYDTREEASKVTNEKSKYSPQILPCYICKQGDRKVWIPRKENK